MKPPAAAPKPYFYSRATVEILLCALEEAERSTPRPVDTTYRMVRK